MDLGDIGLGAKSIEVQVTFIPFFFNTRVSEN